MGEIDSKVALWCLCFLVAGGVMILKGSIGLALMCLLLVGFGLKLSGN